MAPGVLARGFCTGAAGVNVAVKFDVNVVRFGMNYRFDWGGPVVARN